MATIVNILQAQAALRGAKLAYADLDTGARLSFAELDAQARALAARLGPATGERAVILLPQGLDFVVAFFGCLYAGVVAVPSYPMMNARHTVRVQQIARDAEARFVLTNVATLERFDAQRAAFPELAAARWVALDDGVTTDLGPQLAVPVADALAFLQYTSGSTGSPKGVAVTHANLLANLVMLEQAFGHTADSVFVSWLPLFHDMGLIGAMLSAAHVGASAHLMAPATFVRAPHKWLQAVSDHKATMSGGPNFAFDLCVDTIGDERKSSLDLSSWKSAYNGAEPVRAQTLARFAEAFAGQGFLPRMLYPCYGMAETTLIITGGSLAGEPIVQRVEARALEGGRAVPAVDGRALVGCGRAVAGSRVAIVAPGSQQALLPHAVGEIWVMGGHVASGYWRQPAATQETFQAFTTDGAGPWLRTGDMGFLDADGELFVVGRLKDMIIVRGRNVAPQELEWSTEGAHPAVRETFVAAFAIDTADGEGLAIVAEQVKDVVVAPGEVERAVQRAIARDHSVKVATFVLVPAGTLTKTSSGKIQRREARRRLLAGELTTQPTAVEGAK